MTGLESQSLNLFRIITAALKFVCFKRGTEVTGEYCGKWMLVSMKNTKRIARLYEVRLRSLR